jgi:hypothetical protein
MTAIDVEIERIRLCMDATHQSDLRALTSALEEAGLRCADARLAWINEVEAAELVSAARRRRRGRRDASADHKPCSCAAS